MKKLSLLGITLTLLLGLALWQQQLFVVKAAPVFNTLTVINTNDSGAGSLRQAIADAVSGDTITFDTSGVFATPQTILLISGELAINKSLQIQGPGASQVTVSGGGASRVFSISSGNTVTLDGLTVTGGNVGGGGSGGGIFNSGATMTITNCVISNNSAATTGGGIYSRGTMTITNSTVTGNSAATGGGIWNQPASTITIINTTVSGNRATGSGAGGGGIANTNGTMTVTNSTVSGNSAAETGGGIVSSSGLTLTITNSTITGNRADSDGDASGAGGGIFAGTGTYTLNNTIVAGNFVGTGSTPDDIKLSFSTINTANNNLIGDAASAGGITNGVNGNKVGFAVSAVLNTTLANNGGPTLTHALVPGSPALNAGNNALALDAASNPLTTDQRGTGFPRIIGVAVDIGSYEAACAMLVTNTNDSGAGSLRQTIADACPNATITFDTAGVFATSQTITLTSGELVINKSLQIHGPGASQVTISGNNASRVFFIDFSNTVTLDGLTVMGGNGAGTFDPGVGGGISSRGTLTITNSTVSGNSGGTGGGIGVFGTLTVINSTVSGNSGGKGGGIGSLGTVNLINSTVTGNSASIAGGGVLDFGLGGGTTANNTIIAGNTRNDGTTPDDILGLLGSIFRPANNNLIGDAATSGGITNGVNGNIVGNGGAGTIDINTVLNTTLANNGGPTLTHRLKPGSPAIDAGSNALALDAANNPLTTDQRGAGFPRTLDGNGDTTAVVDIGAVEEVQPVLITVTTSPAARSFTVDGTTYTSLQTFNWVPGSSHTIATTSPQNPVAGTRYVFLNWSDSGAISHTVSPTSATTYTASFKTQYQLTTSAGTGGTISPASGFYDAGSSISINATANAGFTFSGFSGALTGTATPQMLNLTGPATVNATFTATTGFNFVGFFQPVDNLPATNSATAGSSIPVKFSLTGYQGLNIFAAGFPASQALACSTGIPDPIEETATAGASGLSYDATTDRYTYVWKTERAWRGTCRKLVVKFTDGTTREALFQFR